MKLIYALTLVFAAFNLGLSAGYLAKSFGRKFWPWFFIGISLPLVVNFVLYYLPDKSKTKPSKLRPVENEEIFGHLFINLNTAQIKDYETCYSATA